MSFVLFKVFFFVFFFFFFLFFFFVFFLRSFFSFFFFSLDQAATEGRLGVRESVCGRMADLGGGATLVTAPGQGAEWELSIPRR